MKLSLQKKILTLFVASIFVGAIGTTQAISIWDFIDGDYSSGSSLDSSSLSGGDPTASQEALDNLSQANLQIAKDEANNLLELQDADFDACKAEASGSGGSGSGNNSGSGSGSGTGSGSGGSSPVGSGGTLGGNEQATREALAEKGIDVNNFGRTCGNLTYQQYKAKYGVSCTNVAGMPQSSIDYLGKVADETGGGVIVNGGTEGGHRAHYPGSLAVDIDDTTQADEYLVKHKVKSWPGDRGTWYQLDDGSKWLDEGNHYHVVTPAKSSGNQVAAVYSNDKNGFLQLATNKIQNIFSWVSKKIKVSLATVVNASNSVSLGGQTIDPSSISTEDLEEIISGLSQSQINSSFSQMSQSALSQLTSRMSFNSLNTVFSNLTSANANAVASTLGGSGFNNIANLLVEESANNIFSNMSVAGFDSLLNGMDSDALNSMIGSIDGSGVDNLLLRANDDILENIFENLDIGGINSIVSSGSEDLLGGVLNSLGSDQLGQILGNVGLSTADRLVDSLGSDLLNEIISGTDSNALNNLLGNLGEDSLSELASSITSGNWENILENITGTTADNLISSLGTDTLNNLVSQLGDGALNDLFGNLSEGTISDLVSSLSGGNWDTVISSLGGDVLNQTLESLGGNLGDILPSLGSSSIIQMLTEGDGSLVDSLLSGVTTDLTESALDLVPDDILEQASDIPIVGDFLSGDGLGGLIGLVGGGLYVPVVEQNGQLMTATQNIDEQTASIDETTQTIDETTQEIRDLNIQICTHLRAIRRIQTNFETMKIADEANANRTRLEAISKYANDVAGKDNPDSLVRTGYTKIVDGEYVQTQVFPQNLNEHLQETREEAKQVILADIKNSENLYKDKVAEIIDDETLTNLNSSLTEEDIKNLKKAGQTSSIKNVATSGFGNKLLAYLPRFISRPMSRLAFWKTAQADGEETTSTKLSADDFWSIFLKSTDPENNPYGSAMLAMQKKEAAQNKAESLARDEYVAAQGILPTGRKCAEEVKDEDGNLVACRKWVVTAGEGAPGTVVRETLVGALNAKLQTYMVPGGPESQPDGSAPNAHEAATTGYSTPTSAAAASGQNNKSGQDSHVQVVNPSQVQSTVQTNQESSGGSVTSGGFGGDSDDDSSGGDSDDTDDGSSLNWSNLLSQLSSLWNTDDGTSSDSSNILEAISTLLGLAQDSFQSQEPLVQTRVLSPTLAKIKSGQKPNQIKLVWASPNSTCEVLNSWYGLKEDKIEIIKEGETSLGKSGTQTILIPKFKTATLKIKGSSTSTETEIDGQIKFKNNFLDSEISFALEENLVPTDLILTLDDQGITVSGSGWQEVINKLNTKLTISWPHIQSLSYSSDTKILSFSFNPTYSILCSNKNGEKLIKFNVER